MYALAYVLLPPNHGALQMELDRALAAFERGGPDELPSYMLTFHDETDELVELHHTQFQYELISGQLKATLPDTEWGWSFHLRSDRLKAHMIACNLDRFTGTFAELEPDLDAFARNFTKLGTRDAKTGKFGQWLNPLGAWDWWELGGRFNGIITGQQRSGGDHQHISSGQSAGRTMIGNLAQVLGTEMQSAEAEIELNVELVETLRSVLGTDEPLLPSAVVLPLGAGPDAGRWIDDIGWRPLKAESRAILGVSSDANYSDIVRTIYDRFPGHTAAAIAYHL
jgi:hypothetical protein